ncbi:MULTISPECIES: GGDEF domain-containing protein [Psychrilyobacter]|uniref:Diguanylate cyclase n=1 Tax=Psychrilyobacter piezotolerans TaxID=2293438 RepID=A0ABX9KGT4_9FUSO|nr:MULTISPECIES: GGDEF domain-containing protein [Psychrilyobacter]MCS5420358.1 GGDEF domain-containing protein [Psychrilyobacter sp. S5]NDI78060.1 GGDEF domain-containing protein [Psychrilyobacter piezotolerans]RDE61651.1 GGDEF domain-containing protein [Psychrilyobacter sp. S5]REI41043.1 diguanylate cyclase [Psychrilyobacter piezotolerans]
MENFKSSKILISYLILIVVTLTLVYLDSSFAKVENPSSKDIISEFLICIQPAIWIYFGKSGFRNSNHCRLMLGGFIILYSGILQDLMDEFYEIEGVLGELENVLVPIGLIIISIAVILRFLEEEKNKLLLSQKTEDIYNKSIKDPLTGLYNRYHLEEHLETILDRLIDIDADVSVAFIDIDNFKAVNDVYGHVKGDEVLTILGTEINRCIRKSDYAFRYGGDEFLIIYPNTKVKTALAITERVKKNISISLKIKGIKSSLSIGITTYQKFENYKNLIDRADKIMYESKRNGKNQITIATS